MKPDERVRGLYRGPKLLARILIRGRYDFVYDQMPISIRNMSWPQRVNLMRSGFNLVHRRVQPWSLPLHMQFELANYCNLHCPVCPVGTGEIVRRPQSMDPALFRKVMREVGPRLLTMSLWGWGESLLHPALGEFLSEARRYNAAVLLSTNGQQLDRDEVIAAILENPPTFLIVAIDGLTDDSNSRFRVGARLEPVLSGMKRIVEARKRSGRALPILHMRFIVMKHNLHELSGVEAFAARSGFDLVTIRTLSLIDSEAGRQTHSELAAEFPGSGSRKQARGARDSRANYICMQPFWFPSLLADGTLVACEQDFNARRPLGVMSDRSAFADLWYSGAATEARRQIRDASHTLSFCSHCPARHRATTDTSVRAAWLRSTIRRRAVIGG